MQRSFAAKTALIFGAGSGIGAGVAQRLAAEGATLFLADIAVEGLERTAAACHATTRVATMTVDIANTASIETLVERMVSEFGRIDLMINAAGMVKSCDFFEVTETDWDRIIAVNQKGTAFAAQIVGRQMVAQASPDAACNGKIVNFSSIAGRRGRAFQLHYAASKAAIISLTQSSALALAPHRINVNAIAPSVVETPMWETHIAQKARTLGISIAEATAEMVKSIPLGRVGTVADIAAAVSFLCSADADFITGQTLNVDGGFEMD